MRKIFFIGAGGMLGRLQGRRFASCHFGKSAGNLPWDTLFINVLGSFLLCFLLSIPLDRRSFAFDLRLGAGIGFLGALRPSPHFAKKSCFYGKAEKPRGRPVMRGFPCCWADGGFSRLFLGRLLFFRPPGRFSGNEEGDGR
jgi:hypothetical protein